jgi:ABC-type transporter Mla MlaB component
VADDDSLSLDFTMPGALPPEPVTPPPSTPLTLELVDVDAPIAAAPIPSAPLAAPAPPTPPPPPPPPAAPAIPPALREAAELHANGDFLAASKKLEALVKSTGKASPYLDTIWLSLFEVLNDLGRREAFDKLALTYAQHIEKSPPAWVAQASAEITRVIGDTVSLSVPPTLDATIGPAIKSLMQSLQPGQRLAIDVSAVRGVDDAGATLALRAMKALRDARREVSVIGAEHLAKLLGETLEPMEREHEAQWLLLVAMFDSLNDQEAFEDAAVNYAVTFEVSPPSWEVRDRSHVRTASAPTSTSATESESATLTTAQRWQGQIVAPCAELLSALAADTRDALEINAAGLQRIDIASAELIAEVLRARHAADKHNTLLNLPPLPLLLFTLRGWSDFATLRARKA